MFFNSDCLNKNLQVFFISRFFLKPLQVFYFSKLFKPVHVFKILLEKP